MGSINIYSKYWQKYKAVRKIGYGLKAINN